MSLGILVALGQAQFEALVLHRLAGAQVHVVRRCVDLADLLACAASRQARVALVSTNLAGLDAESVERLHSEQLATVGIAAVDGSLDAERLAGLGVDDVVAMSDLDRLGAALAEVCRSRAAPRRPAPATLDSGELDGGEIDGAAPSVDEPGAVIAVWGPTGAPGRSLVAAGVAASLAARGASTMLIDADVYGGAQAQLLGVLDESSGLLAAARAANRGSLDVATLASHARSIAPRLRLLTGLPRSDRWIELGPVLLRRVLATSRALAGVTVVDTAFCLETDEEVVYDVAAPRRNGATIAALQCADAVLVVGTADPVGLGRLLRAIGDLRTRVPDVQPWIVVNRVRGSLGWATDDVAGVVRRTTGREVAAFLPQDAAACDRAMVSGRTLVECASGSRLAKALDRLGAALSGAIAGPGQDEKSRASPARV